MKYSLLTSGDMASMLASRLKQLRLNHKWKRLTLAERSGVSVASLIRFEQTAQISMENFLNLMNALGRLEEMDSLLLPPEARSIDELEKTNDKIVKRGSI